MKTIFFVAALLLCGVQPTLALDQKASDGNVVAVIEADNGKTFHVPTGGKLTLTVRTNGGIPYVWKITSEVAPQLTLDGQTEIADTPGLPGGPARVTFTFTAAKPGETTLAADLMSITGGAPARTVSVTVDVTE